MIATVEALRELHPEFRQLVNGPAIRAVLAREEIAIICRPVRRSFVLGFGDDFVITLSNHTPTQERWKRALHEYGHIKLHLTERDEVVRNLVPCTRADPREVEANLFALLLIIGPDATPAHPDVARLVAELEAPRYVARISEQAPLGPPPIVTTKPAKSSRMEGKISELRTSAYSETAPSPEDRRHSKIIPAAFDDGRAYERRLAKQGAQLITAAPVTWIRESWRPDR